jgi:hypothetical protein
VSEGWLEGNRALWDEWADLHAGSAFYDVEGFKRGGVRLAAYEIEEVGDVSGADLLHLQCHFGIPLSRRQGRAGTSHPPKRHRRRLPPERFGDAGDNGRL